MVLTRFILAAAALGTAAVHAAPLAITDQNPFLGGLAAPAPFDARLMAAGGSRLSVTYAVANTANIHSTSVESATIDVESSEWRLTLDRTITRDWSLRATLPYRRYSGGYLDSFIERWHNLIGAPQGFRPGMPRDDIHIQYRRDGVTAPGITQPKASVGDAELAAGYQLIRRPAHAVSLWLSVALPTGNASRLTGNDAFDYSLVLAYSGRLSSRWQWHGQLSGTYLGTSKSVTEVSKLVWSGMTGFEYRYSDKLAILLQLDGHSGAYQDSDIPALKDAVQLSIGAEYRMQERWRVQLAISEDIVVDASPDVTFTLNVARRWGTQQ